jgi:hypothetical protein
MEQRSAGVMPGSDMAVTAKRYAVGCYKKKCCINNYLVIAI